MLCCFVAKSSHVEIFPRHHIMQTYWSCLVCQSYVSGHGVNFKYKILLILFENTLLTYNRCMCSFSKFSSCFFVVVWKYLVHHSNHGSPVLILYDEYCYPRSESNQFLMTICTVFILTSSVRSVLSLCCFLWQNQMTTSRGQRVSNIYPSRIAKVISCIIKGETYLSLGETAERGQIGWLAKY